ncbi:MAG: DUF3822 family protein [Sphingobacteriales bacterium]|nr:MAG: DUF3822 family protein [Sphingobacteriales bacterium]
MDTNAVGNASHVLLEIGSYGISCIWYSPQPMVAVGVCMYHFHEHASGKEVSIHLQKLLTDPEFVGKEIVICLNHKESMLLPAAYVSELTIPAMMDLMYGKDSGAILNDTIRSSEFSNNPLFCNAYRVHPEILDVINTGAQGVKLNHSTSLQAVDKKNSTKLCAIVYHHILKLLLFKDGTVQLVQQFEYKTPADAAYILLNACHQHNLEPEITEVCLSGFIDKDSNLYREISRYFLNVQFDEVHEHVGLEEELKGISAHYFSHLTHLIACV